MASKQTSYSYTQIRGFAGQLLENSPGGIVSMINKEATEAMPFGAAVCFEGSTNDQGALLPDALGDKIAGIVIHSHSYPDDKLAAGMIDANTDLGPKPGQMLNVLRKGRILAVCEEGCVPGDRLHIRVVANGTTEQEGGLRKSADSTDCIDSTNQGVWLTTASAGGLAELEVDFTNSPTIVG